MIALTDPAYARQLDAADELAPFRDRFAIADPDLIYLDGNSLGRLPAATPARLQELIETEWGERLIRGWNEGWFDLPERVGGRLARLLGAAEDEVIVADSTSVNLYKLALAALGARPGRTKIVTDDLNFPSDLYVLQRIARLAGPAHRLEILRSDDGIHAPLEALGRAIDADTALVTLSHTAFKSGYTYDMAVLTQMAHDAGALVLWDTSHSVGALPVRLNDSAADLAIGCTYKYLNGGPGAPAFLYIRRALQSELQNPVSGWMGQANPFAFGLTYAPAAGLRRFLSGTPPVLGLAAVQAGVELSLEAGIDRLRAKSVRQTEYLIALWEELLRPLGFRLQSPRAAEARGSHVSLGHAEGWRINQALIHDLKMLPDFRRPDNIRFGIAPLYNTFAEVLEGVLRLRRAVEEGLYARYAFATPAVT